MERTVHSVSNRLGCSRTFFGQPLVGLPQAAKGQWLNSATFMLDLDLIGAINDYRFKLTFSEDGKSLKASLTERTGLTDEQFQGVLSQ